MTGARNYREIVREIALDNYGFVTTKAAVEAGVPAIELPKLTARGGMENVAYGLYRVLNVPPTAVDQFAEAVFRVGDGAYLHGESVLALLGIADVNPKTVKVAIARRARPKLPSYIELVPVRDEARTTLYEGLKAQRVADAILECREQIETGRLFEAAQQARAEGYLTTSEWESIKNGLCS